MAGSPAYARIKSDILEVVAAVPRGRVTTDAAIGNHLQILPRLVVQLLQSLDDEERTAVAWHRVVAAGGAIGRHAWREEQIRRLKVDGVPVSPAGIVVDIARVAIPDIPAMLTRPGDSRADIDESPAAPSRARGRFDRPATRLK